MGFQGQKAEQVKAIANQLNRLGNRSTDCPCPIEIWSRGPKNTLSHPVASSSRLTSDRGSIEVRSRGAKNTLSHPVASSSRLRFTPSRSTSGRGSIEVRSRQWQPIKALNAQRLVIQLIPNLTGRGYLLLFLTPEPENL